jgi:hypothetical protein
MGCKSCGVPFSSQYDEVEGSYCREPRTVRYYGDVCCCCYRPEDAACESDEEGTEYHEVELCCFCFKESEETEQDKLEPSSETKIELKGKLDALLSSCPVPNVGKILSRLVDKKVRSEDLVEFNQERLDLIAELINHKIAKNAVVKKISRKRQFPENKDMEKGEVKKKHAACKDPPGGESTPELAPTRAPEEELQTSAATRVPASPSLWERATGRAWNTFQLGWWNYGSPNP